MCDIKKISADVKTLKKDVADVKSGAESMQKNINLLNASFSGTLADLSFIKHEMHSLKKAVENKIFNIHEMQEFYLQQINDIKNDIADLHKTILKLHENDQEN